MAHPTEEHRVHTAPVKAATTSATATGQEGAGEAPAMVEEEDVVGRVCASFNHVEEGSSRVINAKPHTQLSTQPIVTDCGAGALHGGNKGNTGRVVIVFGGGRAVVVCLITQEESTLCM